MKRVLSGLIAFSAIILSFGQDNKNDTNSVQAILDAYYASISGPIGTERDFERLRSLFHPQARLIYSYWNADNSKNSLLIMTLEEMIGKLGYTVEKGFFEQELTNRQNSFSSVTQVFSTYKFWTEDKSISGQGITSYEFYHDGERFWIVSMLWTAENDKFKIPEEFLNKS